MEEEGEKRKERPDAPAWRGRQAGWVSKGVLPSPRSYRHRLPSSYTRPDNHVPTGECVRTRGCKSTQQLALLVVLPRLSTLPKHLQATRSCRCLLASTLSVSS